jgi:hypothetical protein
MIKIAGYILLVVSCLLFIMIPVIPWFDLSKSQIAGITTVLIIAGEILFYLSLSILGKSFFDKIKTRLKFWKARPVDLNLPEQGENK